MRGRRLIESANKAGFEEKALVHTQLPMFSETLEMPMSRKSEVGG